ncbi:hypothetical protein ES708_07653 [subsurface metagenome]
MKKIKIAIAGIGNCSSPFAEAFKLTEKFINGKRDN